MEQSMTNPVIPGFAPDPSLVYVDGTYFLVNSSFHMFPGLPVYASKDLKDWKHIGNALNKTRWMTLQNSSTRLSSLGDEAELMAGQGGIMAPSIRYHKGTFYIICTTVNHDGHGREFQLSDFTNFILSTSDIWADEWNDPVFYDFFGIDTSLFWDDDDRAYVIGAAAPAPASKIKQFEIDVKTGKKLSEEVLLWEGITKVFPEGPHMYKKDGWYYLLIAEGGCFADHHTIMARSRNVWGPFEPNPLNPVLGKANPRGYIQYTSHGDLFQDHLGQWYFVCLGVRKNKGRFIMGRESVLTTASWPDGEFPVIDTVPLNVPLPAQQTPSPAWPARRKADRPDVAFLHIRDPIEANYEYDENNIILTASKADVSQSAEPVTFIGQRQRRLDGSSSVTLSALTLPENDRFALQTGLCYYKDEHRFVKVFLDVISGEIVFEIINKARSISRRISRVYKASKRDGRLTFGVDYTEMALTFWYSIQGEAKQELECIDSLDMTGHDFVGPVIGIYAVGDDRIKVKYSGFSVA